MSESVEQAAPRRRVSVETLARALYETEAGQNGYPPPHESTPWADIQWRDSFYDRACEIIAKLGISCRNR